MLAFLTLMQRLHHCRRAVQEKGAVTAGAPPCEASRCCHVCKQTCYVCSVVADPEAEDPSSWVHLCLECASSCCSQSVTPRSLLYVKPVWELLVEASRAFQAKVKYVEELPSSLPLHGLSEQRRLPAIPPFSSPFPLHPCDWPPLDPPVAPLPMEASCTQGRALPPPWNLPALLRGWTLEQAWGAGLAGMPQPTLVQLQVQQQQGKQKVNKGVACGQQQKRTRGPKLQQEQPEEAAYHVKKEAAVLSTKRAEAAAAGEAQLEGEGRGQVLEACFDMVPSSGNKDLPIQGASGRTAAFAHPGAIDAAGHTPRVLEGEAVQGGFPAVPKDELAQGASPAAPAHPEQRDLHSGARIPPKRQRHSLAIAPPHPAARAHSSGRESGDVVQGHSHEIIPPGGPGRDTSEYEAGRVVTTGAPPAALGDACRSSNGTEKGPVQEGALLDPGSNARRNGGSDCEQLSGEKCGQLELTFPGSTPPGVTMLNGCAAEALPLVLDGAVQLEGGRRYRRRAWSHAGGVLLHGGDVGKACGVFPSPGLSSSRQLQCMMEAGGYCKIKMGYVQGLHNPALLLSQQDVDALLRLTSPKDRQRLLPFTEGVWTAPPAPPQAGSKRSALEEVCIKDGVESAWPGAAAEPPRHAATPTSCKKESGPQGGGGLQGNTYTPASPHPASTGRKRGRPCKHRRPAPPPPTCSGGPEAAHQRTGGPQPLLALRMSAGSHSRKEAGAIEEGCRHMAHPASGVPRQRSQPLQNDPWPSQIKEGRLPPSFQHLPPAPATHSPHVSSDVSPVTAEGEQQQEEEEALPPPAAAGSCKAAAGRGEASGMFEGVGKVAGRLPGDCGVGASTATATLPPVAGSVGREARVWRKSERGREAGAGEGEAHSGENTPSPAQQQGVKRRGQGAGQGVAGSQPEAAFGGGPLVVLSAPVEPPLLHDRDPQRGGAAPCSRPPVHTSHGADSRGKEKVGKGVEAFPPPGAGFGGEVSAKRGAAQQHFHESPAQAATLMSAAPPSCGGQDTGCVGGSCGHMSQWQLQEGRGGRYTTVDPATLPKRAPGPGQLQREGSHPGGSHPPAMLGALDEERNQTRKRRQREKRLKRRTAGEDPLEVSPAAPVAARMFFFAKDEPEVVSRAPFYLDHPSSGPGPAISRSQPPGLGESSPSLGGAAVPELEGNCLEGVPHPSGRTAEAGPGRKRRPESERGQEGGRAKESSSEPPARHVAAPAATAAPCQPANVAMADPRIADVAADLCTEPDPANAAVPSPTTADARQQCREKPLKSPGPRRDIPIAGTPQKGNMEGVPKERAEHAVGNPDAMEDWTCELANTDTAVQPAVPFEVQLQAAAGQPSAVRTLPVSGQGRGRGRGRRGRERGIGRVGRGGRGERRQAAVRQPRKRRFDVLERGRSPERGVSKRQDSTLAGETSSLWLADSLGADAGQGTWHSMGQEESLGQLLIPIQIPQDPEDPALLPLPPAAAVPGTEVTSSPLQDRRSPTSDAHTSQTAHQGARGGSCQGAQLPNRSSSRDPENQAPEGSACRDPEFQLPKASSQFATSTAPLSPSPPASLPDIPHLLSLFQITAGPSQPPQPPAAAGRAASPPVAREVAMESPSAGAGEPGTLADWEAAGQQAMGQLDGVLALLDTGNRLASCQSLSSDADIARACYEALCQQQQGSWAGGEASGQDDVPIPSLSPIPLLFPPPPTKQHAPSTPGSAPQITTPPPNRNVLDASLDIPPLSRLPLLEADQRQGALASPLLPLHVSSLPSAQLAWQVQQSRTARAACTAGRDLSASPATPQAHPAVLDSLMQSKDSLMFSHDVFWPEQHTEAKAPSQRLAGGGCRMKGGMPPLASYAGGQDPSAAEVLAQGTDREGGRLTGGDPTLASFVSHQVSHGAALLAEQPAAPADPAHQSAAASSVLLRPFLPPLAMSAPMHPSLSPPATSALQCGSFSLLAGPSAASGWAAPGGGDFALAQQAQQREWAVAKAVLHGMGMTQRMQDYQKSGKTLGEFLSHTASKNQFQTVEALLGSFGKEVAGTDMKWAAQLFQSLWVEGGGSPDSCQLLLEER